MSTRPSLLLLLALVVTCHAKIDVKVTPNCVERKDPQTCAKMTITLTFLYPSESEPWTSDTLLLDFEKRFGDETCNFYISVKHEPVSFLSICTNDHGVNKFEGAFFHCSFNVNFNDETSQHEFGYYGMEYSGYRSISADESGSFCRIIDESLFPDDKEDQVPHVRRQQPSLSKDAVIEIAFAADYLFLEHYGSPAKVEKVIFQIINGMRAMYQQLDVGIEAVDVFIFDEKLTSDLIKAVNDFSDLKWKYLKIKSDRYIRSAGYSFGVRDQYRDNFTDRGVGRGGGKRARISGFPDAVITFTTRPFDNIEDLNDTTLGFAPVGFLCSKKSQAFILMPKWYADPKSNSGLLANQVLTVVHELGHLLGLDHLEACGCADELKGKCIMYYTNGHQSGDWSSCSKAQVRSVLQNPYLTPNKSKECLFTKDAYSRNAPLYVPVGSPVVKTKPPKTTKTTAISNEQRPLHVPFCPPFEQDTDDISRRRTTISPGTARISRKTLVIIVICVLAAVIVVAVLCKLRNRSGPPVSISSRRLYQESQNRQPKRSVSRQSSRDSQKSRRAASPERQGQT